MSEILNYDEVPDDRSPVVRFMLLVCSMFVAAIVLLTFTQVVLRFGFNRPQAWAEEVGRYLFVWIVFLGAAVAAARDTHIKVDSLTEMMQPDWRRAVDIFRRLVELGAVGMLAYSGIITAWRYRGSAFYTVPWMPQVLFYLAVPVSAVLMIIFMTRNLLALRSA